MYFDNAKVVPSAYNRIKKQNCSQKLFEKPNLHMIPETSKKQTTYYKCAAKFSSSDISVSGVGDKAVA